ncbi:MAG: sulfite exporter TauE/SafE family protein [Colwellia sp.]|nr:sulfite exporter TauE/SafE family protein [Colwellia sp.]
MLAIEWVLSFLLLGSLVGFVAGLLGVGGGGIMVPILTIIFLYQGVDADSVMHLALGTSMAAIIFTSISSLRAHQTHRTIKWNIVKLMSFGVIFGTFIATFLAAQLSSLYLAIFFTLFMAYVAIKLLVNKQINTDNCHISNKNLLFSASGIGAISALVSIGGGSLTVPYLVSKGINVKKAIGTSAAIGLPISIAGTLGYLINGWDSNLGYEYTLGFIYLPAVFLISITSFFTAPYGAKLAQHLPISILKKVFACLLILLSLKMLLSIIS